MTKEYREMILRLLAIVLMTVVLTACSTSKDEAANKYLSSGMEFFNNSDYGKARVELRNALQIDPDLVSAHYYLALVSEKEQEWKKLYKRLSRVELLDENHIEARIKMGYLLLLAQQPDAALEKAEEILRIEKDNPDAYTIKASAYLAKELYDVALEYAQKALGERGEYSEIVSIQASALHKQGRTKSALLLLTSAIQSEDDPLHLLLLRIDINQEIDDLVAVESDYRQLISQYPDEKAFYIKLARLLGAEGRLREARATLEGYLENYPKDNQVKLAIVEVVELRDSIAASQLLSDYIADDPKNAEFRFYLVNKLVSEKKSIAALPLLEQIVSGDFEEQEIFKAKAMLAALLFEQNNWDRGLQLVSEVLEEDRQFEAALLARANYYLKTEEFEAAIADLRVVLRNNPESEQALVMLATAYMTTGSDQLAYESFKKALDINPGNTQAAVPVIRSLLEKSEIDRSEQILENALAHSPDNEFLLSILAQIKLSQEDITSTQELISRIERKGKNPAFGNYLSAKVLQVQGNCVHAIDKYKEALKHDPRLNRALEGLAYCYGTLKKQQELLEYLIEFKADNPELISAYSILASMYQRQGDQNSAIATIKEGLGVDSGWVRGYSLLAHSYKRQGDVERSIQAYNAGLEVLPDNMPLKLLLASSYENSGQFQQAKELYEELLLDYPNHQAVINNLASLLTDRFESPENIKRAVTLTAQFASSEQPYFVDTYAWALVRAGKPELAEPLFKRVVEMAPDVAIFHFHYGKSLKLLGKLSEARQAFVKAEALAEGQETLLEYIRADLLEL